MTAIELRALAKQNHWEVEGIVRENQLRERERYVGLSEARKRLQAQEGDDIQRIVFLPLAVALNHRPHICPRSWLFYSHEQAWILTRNKPVFVLPTGTVVVSNMTGDYRSQELKII